jgi:hypothetical protein
MGWGNYHLYSFDIADIRIELPDEEGYEDYEWENDEAEDWYPTETKVHRQKILPMNLLMHQRAHRTMKAHQKEKLQMTQVKKTKDADPKNGKDKEHSDVEDVFGKSTKDA